MEFTADMYRSEKLRRYHGVKLTVTPDRARRHLAMLKGDPYFMSNARIAQLAGICESNLSQIIRGYRAPARNNERVQEIHRDTEAAILGVQPRVEEVAKGGGNVNPTGARRRMQALVAAGFPLAFLSTELDWGKDPQPVHRLVTGKSARKYVYASTDRKVKRLYGKLELVKPEDMGFTDYAMHRARQSAVKHGYAPPGAWDETTIDDPEAEAEWTGACGSMEGYGIHQREGIPLCQPCTQARLDDPGNSTNLPDHDFSAQKLIEARELAGLSRNKLAKLSGVDNSSIVHWEKGRNNPRPASLDAIAMVLGVPVLDFYVPRMR